MLPGFGAGTPNPGRALTPLPGVVVYDIDRDGDGAIDGDLPPIVDGNGVARAGEYLLILQAR